MRKNILLVSNLNNPSFADDVLVAKELGKDYNVTIANLRTLLKGIKYINGCFDALLVRNIRSKPKNEKDFKLQIKAEKILRTGLKNKKVYNPLSAKGDMWGKKYLVDLYKSGYPVIPSAMKRKGIKNLPLVDKYVIKPFFGYSRWGIKYVSKEQLRKIKLKDEIIQPVIDFKYEIAFYVIDGQLQHTLIFSPNKVVTKKARFFKPSDKDKAFVRKFVRWNKMEYGIQRIDALRLKNGALTLMEIEDLSPSVGLKYLNENNKNIYVKKLVSSFTKSMFK